MRSTKEVWTGRSVMSGGHGSGSYTDVNISAWGNSSRRARTTFSEPPGTVSHSWATATRAEVSVEARDKAIRRSGGAIVLDGPAAAHDRARAALARGRAAG